MMFVTQPPEDKTMKKYITLHCPANIACALRDGLIITLGLAVSLGTLFNSQITMWAAGA